MEANTRQNLGMPPEVIDFLNGRGGRSLIVKGGAGTGKTTFGLELLEKLGRPGQSFYLSTRVSDDALYRQFPWLRGTEMRARIFDAGKMFLETLMAREREVPTEPPAEVKEKISTARDFLKSIGQEQAPPTKVDRTQLTALLKHTRMPEVEHMYDRVEGVLPEKALLVVDSLEGVTHKYGLEMEEFVMCLQKDLAENSNTNVVMILEKPEAGGIEYLVDGLLSFSREEWEERRVRHMRLDKLRATAIPRPRYAVTLAGGRFQALGISNQRVTTGPASTPWTSVRDPPRYYSTGIPDFDSLLGGGYQTGSYNGFEIDVNVSIDDYYLLFVPAFLNFLSQGRGIMGILAGGESPERLRQILTAYVPPETFDNRVRFTDYFNTESSLPYVLPLGRVGREDAIRTLSVADRAVRGADQKPIMEYTAFDTLEYLQGDAPAIRGLFIGMERTKLRGDVGIGLLKPGLVVTSEIINMMDTYFRVVKIDNSPCIYGIRPRTMIYSISIDSRKGVPYTTLTPIV